MSSAIGSATTSAAAARTPPPASDPLIRQVALFRNPNVPPLRSDFRKGVLLGKGGAAYVYGFSFPGIELVVKVQRAVDDKLSFEREVKNGAVINELQIPNAVPLWGVLGNYTYIREDQKSFTSDHALVYPNCGKPFIYLPEGIKNAGLIFRNVFETLSHLQAQDPPLAHCDLKPDNILMKGNQIMIIDWDRVSYCPGKIVECPTAFTYCAPEFLAMHQEFTCAIDVWTVGCSALVLFSRKQFSGTTAVDALESYITELGSPPQEWMEKSRKKDEWFPKGPNGVRAFYKTVDPSKEGEMFKLAQTRSKMSDEWKTLIKLCLAWIPEARIKPTEALKLPILAATK